MIKADVIIVAAGSGARYGAPKQLESLLGKPLYRHSLDTFLLHPEIGSIILVTSEELMKALAADASERVTIVLGGATRQQSVHNGLQALALDIASPIVLVHDAARPGVDEHLITELITACEEFDAAIAALPVVDTLKREEKELAVATVSRACLWRAQTPQGARKELLAEAFKVALADGYEATDESELLERISIYPKLVPGSEKNIKVTYPEDLARLEKLL